MFWPSLWVTWCSLGPGLRHPETPSSGQVRPDLAKGWGLVSQNSPFPHIPALPKPQDLFIQSPQARPEGSSGQRRCPLSAPVPPLSPAHRSSCSPQLWKDRSDFFFVPATSRYSWKRQAAASCAGRPCLLNSKPRNYGLDGINMIRSRGLQRMILL